MHKGQKLTYTTISHFIQLQSELTCLPHFIQHRTIFMDMPSVQQHTVCFDTETVLNSLTAFLSVIVSAKAMTAGKKRSSTTECGFF